MKVLKSSVLAIILVFFACSEEIKYPELEDGLYAEIVTVDGNIVLNLEFEKVPATVGNFVSLAEGTNKMVTDSMKEKPYYNGLNFHRVISRATAGNQDFMIQGGCPLGTGGGDPGYRFADEIPRDSVGDVLFKHDRPGVLSMANGGPDSNGSQFFIMLEPRPHLDGVHAVFGNVVMGQKVAHNLQKKTVIEEVNIIRVGKKAKNFNAFKTFKKFVDIEREKAKEIEKIEQETIAHFLKLKEEAQELSPDLKIYFLEKGDGAQPELESNIRIGYAAYFTDGSLLDTNIKDVAKKFGMYNQTKEVRRGYEPFKSTYSMNERLVQGFKEGLQEMKFGEKALLYLPAHLAWGEQGSRGVPPNSDIIFRVELYPPN
ncbi:peptidylprolyl isomerase [Urechidicola vernalis]|uniref:peptidylprolyl isomerase n=1 Tax=Urechidicola vernalis TaxID=3075600 RepID=A0ABU2Y1T2_9FLAO|nr:peptidylprolyl isomerase [Urechidicola sp. P050]MDT0552169.1 peptidylprolyl isomerase [Urechidicola sp. P050]